ncbi:MAG: hypothetical protein AB8B97_07665 [Granulosicoccus sp.]
MNKTVIHHKISTSNIDTSYAGKQRQGRSNPYHTVCSHSGFFQRAIEAHILRVQDKTQEKQIDMQQFHFGDFLRIKTDHMAPICVHLRTHSQARRQATALKV